MSGIAGIYNLDHCPVEAALLQRMTDSISHRGPDGAGHWIAGAIGLGHRMLRTTPESRDEKQPLMDASGHLCLTADVRLDNREDLMHSLSLHGKPQAKITDAELILQAYERWGEACPTKLLGDFAFALWDARNQTLFCARDAIGIKPLYYYVDDTRLLFASEPQQLFQSGLIPKNPNLALLGRYLLNDYAEESETLYAGVMRLPAACSMLWQGRHKQQKRYWDIDPGQQIHYRTDAEYAEHFFALFQEAVKSCLRSTGPVGASLSGGLDSSSIVCTAQWLYHKGLLARQEFETFSIVFDDLPCDERPYIKTTVQKWGLTANMFPFEQLQHTVFLENTRSYPDVWYEPTLFMQIPIMASARQKGIKVMLNGIGGDDLLAGAFEHLADLLKQFRLADLITQLKADAFTHDKHPLHLFLHSALKPLLPHAIRSPLGRLVRRLRRQNLSGSLHPAFARHFHLQDGPPQAPRQRRFPTYIQDRLYRDLRYGWNVNIGLGLFDLFSARCAVELRYPFFDKRLVEYLLALPEEQRWRFDRPKTVLRHAMQGILPDEIRERKLKTDFCPVIDKVFKDTQQREVEKLLDTSALVAEGIVDGEAMQYTYKSYCQGKEQYLTLLIVFVGLELWYRMAFQQEELI